MPIRERGERDDDRDRDTERDRDRDRDRERERRRRSRSRDRGERRSRRTRSRTRSRSRSPSHRSRRSSSVNTAGPSGKHEEPPMSSLTEEERQMKELLGFGSFHSTKGLNDFAVWGASCVDGKQREDLSDFKEYQDWMLKKKLVVMKRDAARPLPRSYEPNGRSFRDARHRSPPSRFSSHHPRLSSDDRRRRPPPSPLRRSSPNYRSVQPSRRQSPSPHRRLPLSPRWRHASPSARRHPSPLRRHASPSSRRYASPSSRRHTSPSVRSHASPSPRRRASPSSRRHRYPSPLIVMDEVLPTVLSRLANSPERKVPSRRYGAPSPPSHRPPGIPESYDERNACPDTPYAQRMHCSPMSRGPNRSWCYPPSPDSRPLPLRHSLHPPELTDNYC